MTIARLLPASLVLAALALVAIGPAAGDGMSLPPGVVVLLVAALIRVIRPGRLGAWLGLAAAFLVGVVALGHAPGDLGGDRGFGVAALRVVELGALLVACVAAVRHLSLRLPRGARRRRILTRRHERDWTRSAQLVGLVTLCAIGAELLAAYGDSTGHVGRIVFSLVFFAALYGAPALLAREFVRRRGWGWPSMLLLFTALGVTEACLIDQSLFSSDYQGYDGWEETREATLIPALGISAFNAYNFILGHVIFSFGAPVALAEGWRPARAREPWLGTVGILVAALVYVGAGALILFDPESRSASPEQLVVSAGAVGVLVAAAVVVGGRGIHRRSGRLKSTNGQHPVSVWATLAVALAAALVSAMVSENWAGFTVGIVAIGAVGFAVLRVAKYPGWSIRHVAAVGVGFLLARGLLAFTYFPLIGEVAPTPKYLHNAVMILVVALAGWMALRPRPSRLPGRESSPANT